MVGASDDFILWIAFMSNSYATVPAGETSHCQLQSSKLTAGEPAAPVAESFTPIRLPNSVQAGRVMIVDDERQHVLTVRQHLKQAGLQCFLTTTCPHDVMALMHSEQPDVVLLDMEMPEINGTDILRAVRFDPSLRRIPVIGCYESTVPEQRRKAMESGAHDVLSKPYDPQDLVLSVRNSILLKLEVDQNARERTRLEALIGERTEELQHSRSQLILSLARAAEFRDNETGHHVVRVGRFAAIIAEGLGWEPDRVELIEQAAQLHDVGKIGIPDAIICKAGSLSDDEYTMMKTHPERSFEIIRHIDHLSRAALGAARHHHERFDGNGYPLGLRGAEIPIEARVVSIADTYDAITSSRSYRAGRSHEQALAIIRECADSQLDPRLVEVFDNIWRRDETPLALLKEPVEPHDG